jgi:hypothetical protein
MRNLRNFKTGLSFHQLLFSIFCILWATQTECNKIFIKRFFFLKSLINSNNASWFKFYWQKTRSLHVMMCSHKNNIIKLMNVKKNIAEKESPLVGFVNLRYLLKYKGWFFVWKMYVASKKIEIISSWNLEANVGLLFIFFFKS